MIVTTKSDIITIDGVDTRKKVFMVRGDESYAHSTNITLNRDESIDTGSDVKGFCLALTGEIYRNIGSSNIIIYDGEEILKTFDINDNQHSFRIDDLYLSYNVEHELYAVLKGNNQCMGSKSKKLNLSVPLPDELHTSITFNNVPTNIEANSSIPLNLTAKQSNVNVPDGTIVRIYDNNNHIADLETTGGVASMSITNVAQGRHTITASIEESATVTSVSSSIDVSAGYDIIFYECPSVFFNNADNIVKFKVQDYFGDSVSNATVNFTNQHKVTNSQGIATFTIRNINNNTNYSASVGTSSVSKLLNSFTVSSINIGSEDGIVATNYNEQINIKVNGEGYDGELPLTISDGESFKEAKVFGNKDYIYTYQGQGRGDVTITASCGNTGSSVQIEDLKMGYKALSYEYDLRVGMNLSEYTLDSKGMLIILKPTALNGAFNFITENPSNSIEFKLNGVQSAKYISLGLKNGGMYTFTNPSLQNTDVVKIVREDSQLLYYLNDELVHTNSVGDGITNMWEIGFTSYPDNKYPPRIRIDELKIK